MRKAFKMITEDPQQKWKLHSKVTIKLKKADISGIETHLCARKNFSYSWKPCIQTHKVKKNIQKDNRSMEINQTKKKRKNYNSKWSKEAVDVNSEIKITLLHFLYLSFFAINLELKHYLPNPNIKVFSTPKVIKSKDFTPPTNIFFTL